MGNKSKGTHGAFGSSPKFMEVTNEDGKKVVIQVKLSREDRYHQRILSKYRHYKARVK